MDTRNNVVVSGEEFRRLLAEDPEAAEAFSPLPPNLQRAAATFLRGRPSAKVARHSGGALSRFAAGEREKERLAARGNAKRKRRSRKAMEKATRKAQRTLR